MPDIFTKEKRSEVMSKIKGKNTKLELMVFKELRRQHIYFQKHYRKAPGSPDIAMPRKKVAVFIDGDFWHGYKFEIRKQKLSHQPYWLEKIGGNIKRDKKNRAKLRKAGWRILRVWEHEIHKKDGIGKILKFIQDIDKKPE